MADAAILYRWRVEGERSSWYEGPDTTREGHDRWLQARLDSPAVKLWVAQIAAANIPIGTVRLDSNDELSVHIDPAWRGMGYGAKAIRAACDHAEHRVKACVDAENKGAARAFLRAGFVRRPDVDFYLLRP